MSISNVSQARYTDKTITTIHLSGNFKLYMGYGGVSWTYNFLFSKYLNEVHPWHRSSLLAGSGVNCSYFREEKAPNPGVSNSARASSSLHRERCSWFNINTNMTVVMGTGQFLFLVHMHYVWTLNVKRTLWHILP